MKLRRQRKALIPLLSILLLILIPSIYTNQIKESNNPEEEITQEQEDSKTSKSSKNKLTLEEAVQITKKDGSQIIVPVITGLVIWWIILSIFIGTLVILISVIITSAIVNKQRESEERDQYLSEALPNLIKGITIVYIVIAVLLLSILGIISAEGTLSILAGISGYVLGKEKVKDKLPTEVKPPQKPKE